MTVMTKANFDAFMKEWRGKRHKDGAKITEAELDLIRAAISGTWSPVAIAGEPAWLTEARRLIGTKEISGPQHASFIAKGWARLGAGWFNDDETPWCGFFVAHCLDAVGEPFPGKGQFARALAWKEWGKACLPAVGAVVVFQRPGGGHVGFLVGESAKNYYVLGGNQSNAVNITPIAKNRAVATRWPASHPAPVPGLPQMSGGTISSNEA